MCVCVSFGDRNLVVNLGGKSAGGFVVVVVRPSSPFRLHFSTTTITGQQDKLCLAANLIMMLDDFALFYRQMQAVAMAIRTL